MDEQGYITIMAKEGLITHVGRYALPEPMRVKAGQRIRVTMGEGGNMPTVTFLPDVEPEEGAR